MRISDWSSDGCSSDLWDGEWQITYETFRDMGIAYAAGLVLIYLLVVASFRNYLVPLVIMAPIPLTVIGVMPGHARMGMQARKSGGEGRRVAVRVVSGCRRVVKKNKKKNKNYQI